MECSFAALLEMHPPSCIDAARLHSRPFSHSGRPDARRHPLNTAYHGTFLNKESDIPSFDSLVLVVKSGRQSKDPSRVRHAYAVVCEQGLELFDVLANDLVVSFVECGSIFSAQQVLNRSFPQNRMSLNTLLHCYIESGDWSNAFNLLQIMRAGGDHVLSHVFILLLKACSSRKWLKRGEILHAEIVKEASEKDPIIGTALVHMYAKCGALAEARNVFDRLLCHDVVSWTALMGGYSEHGLWEEVLSCIQKMEQEGILRNSFTFVCSLKACGSMGDVTVGHKLHVDIIMYGLETHYFVCNTLVDMYAALGVFTEARYVLRKSSGRDIISWNLLITGYVDHGFYHEALHCLDEMQAENFSPDVVTHVCCLKACRSISALEMGRKIHMSINKGGFESDLFLGSILIDMYASCGFLAEAQKTFDDLHMRDVVSWTALIGAYLQQGLGMEAFSCLEQMQREGIYANGITFVCSLKACAAQKSINQGRKLHYDITKEGFEMDTFVGNTLIQMYAKCDSLLEALDVFHELPTRNVVSWNAAIAAYLQHDLYEEALSCFDDMERAFTSPDAVTYISCLKACGNLGAIEKGQEIHTKIVKMGFDEDDSLCNNLENLDFNDRRNVFDEPNGNFTQGSVKLNLANALIDMYGKCGSMSDSQNVFDESSTKDRKTWTGLVTGYSRQGECPTVFYLFETMVNESIKPDGITFISLLNACGHSGLLDTGEKFFEMMNEFCLDRTVEHHNCMVDLFGRAGLLERAMTLLLEMPFTPDSVLWSTILCACHRWGTTELARQTFEYTRGMEAYNAQTLVLMANIYAASMWED